MQSKDNIILYHDVKIKKIGVQIFLLRVSFDYSKKRLVQLTETGKDLVEYIKTVRTVQDVLNHFSEQIDEESITKYLDYLCANEYAVVWGKDNIEQYKSISSFQKEIWMEEHTPYGATLELTSRCNFRCVHCYLDNCHDTQDLTLEQIKYILDILNKAGMMTIFLSGGEPLFRKDFKEIYLYARQLGFLVVIFTNGFLLNDELLDLFLQYPPLEIDISLYGSNDEVYKKVTGVDGAFTKIHENIIKYIRNGIFVSAKTPVLSLMEEDLSKIHNFSKEMNIPWRITFNVLPTIDNVSKQQYQISAHRAAFLFKEYSDNYRAEVDLLTNSLKKGGHLGRRRYACGMGKSSCFVDYRGYVSPCIETRHRAVSIFENTFETVWEKIRQISYEQMAQTNLEGYRCLSCSLACICKSCPAVRERYYGSPTIVKDADCAFTKALYELIQEVN